MQIIANVVADRPKPMQPRMMPIVAGVLASLLIRAVIPIPIANNDNSAPVIGEQQNKHNEAIPNTSANIPSVLL